MAVTVVTQVDGYGQASLNVKFEGGGLLIESDGYLTVADAGNNRHLAKFTVGSWIYAFTDDEAVEENL